MLTEQICWSRRLRLSNSTHGHAWAGLATLLFRIRSVPHRPTAYDAPATPTRVPGPEPCATRCRRRRRNDLTQALTT